MIKTFEQYSYSVYYKRLEDTVKTAAETLADNILKEFDLNFLNNATDLQECDGYEISWIISMVNGDGFSMKEIDDLDEHNFSIKDIFLKKKHINHRDIIDQWVEDNWEDLDEDTVDALNDYFDMGGILGKKQLNGGRYEAFRNFQMLVADNVINKIKESLLAVKDHDNN
jgi:hypothetical protein